MELDIAPCSDGTIVSTLKGRLDTVSSPEFAVSMMPLLDNADKHIILDCGELEYVASSGLRQLLLLRKQTIAMGGDITLRNVQDSVRQVFTIAGFTPLFSFE